MFENEIIIYKTKNLSTKIEVKVENETVWLTQAQMAELFKTTRNNITLHISNIFKEQELVAKSVCKDSLLTAKDGKNYKTKIYNLDVIISVGYRVKSKHGTQFRIWATKTLKQHITKGYTINKKVLQKNYQEFLKTVEDIKLLAKNNEQIKSDDILELIKTFSGTWFNLESYDKQNFPQK